MASSSSSSSSSGAVKRSKKKAKKQEKKERKVRKKEKKTAKRAQRADAWNCDRKGAVRLIRDLLQKESSVEDLESVFVALDAGEVVRLEGIHDKQLRKKLRHLLQALRLATAEGSQSFKSADLKVSFVVLFKHCLAAARGKEGGAPPTQAARPEEAVSLQGDGSDGGSPGDAPERLPAGPTRPRVVGPQLPLPGIGAGASDDAASSGDEAGVERGPKVEGAEREGVDLSSLRNKRKREDWMTKPSDAMAGVFGEAAPSTASQFEVKRSKEEQEAFANMYKDRGPSLLERQRTGEFEASREAAERARQQKLGTPSVWGMSEKEQVRESQAAAKGSTSAAPARAARRTFDPERDMEVRTKISPDAFSKLVENSGAGLAGRFSGGHVAKSFL